MNDSPSATDVDDDLEPDPMFVNSLREGGWILLLWVACFAWTMFSCLTNGYIKEVDPETFPTVLGMPAWVAWGIALPWLIANAVTVYFCFGYMQDGDLGPDISEDEASSGQSAGSLNLSIGAQTEGASHV